MIIRTKCCIYHLNRHTTNNNRNLRSNSLTRCRSQFQSGWWNLAVCWETISPVRRSTDTEATTERQLRAASQCGSSKQCRVPAMSYQDPSTKPTHSLCTGLFCSLAILDPRVGHIYLCPLSFWLTLPRWVLSTSWCCPPRPCMVFLAFVHLALFLASSLSPGNSLVSSWCDHSMLASLLWWCLTVPSLLQLS